MSNPNTVTSAKAGVDFYRTTTTPQFALGAIALGTNASEWVYVQAAGVIAQYYAVTVDENGQAAALTAAAVLDNHSIGWAQVAFANDDYGWICKRASGGINIQVRASCAADVPLYTTASAGVLDDASTGQSLVQGVVVITAATASGPQPEEAIATWPRNL